MRAVLFILGLALLLALLVLAASVEPAYVTLAQPEQAFVYADEGAVVLVLEEGQYTLGSTRLPAGCYRLDPPEPGMDRGRAFWVGERCP